MGFIVKRYRLLIFLCFIHYNVNSHLIHSSHRFPDLFKTDRDEETKTRVSEGTQTSRLSIKTGHGWRSSDAIMAGHNGDASSETHREILAWKDSVDRRLRDLEMGSRPFPEEQAEPEVKREIDTCGGDIKRLTDEVIQVRRELEAAKTDLKDVHNALATINNDREAHIDKQMTAHGTQEIITNPIGHVTDGDLKAFKDAHGELKTKLDHQKETLLNLNKTKGNGVVEPIQELQNQVSSEQESPTKLHVSMDHLIHDTIVDNLKVAIASQYIESTASPAKRRQRREGIGALTTAITSFLSELQQYNKTIQDEKTELMRMSHDSVTGNDLVKLEKCQTDVRTLAQNLENTETVLDLIQVGLREEKRFVRSHFDALNDSLNSFINQRDLLETNLNETTDRLASVSDELSNVIMEVDSVSTSIWTIQDNYSSSTNAQIHEIKDDVDTLKMLCTRSLSGGWSDWTLWTGCSVTCERGSISRDRQCNNPTPAYGGEDCRGDSSVQRECDTGVYCPVHGDWSVWGSWSSCTATCGGGTYTHSRTCNNPVPLNNGNDCSGSTTETVACNTNGCPGFFPPTVDGGWSNWAMWSTCSATCAGGRASRSRACDNPAPAYSGADCSGSGTEITICNTSPCPVDGGLTTWTAWATCSVICGGGSQRRTRSCSNPSPAHGGAVCTEATSKTQTCNTHNCPNPCDNGYIHYAPFCLRIVLAPKSSFDDAVSACQDENAHLMTGVVMRMLHSTGLTSIAPELVKKNYYHFWIGVKRNASSVFVWLSSDEPLFKHDPMWSDPEPNNQGGAEHCVEWPDNYGGLNDVPCNASNSFICEKSEYE